LPLQLAVLREWTVSDAGAGGSNARGEVWLK
jgi:hypothetical protein